MTLSHSSSPVKRLRAITWAWSVTMKTRSPATATPRLALPDGEAGRARPLVVPDAAAAAGVERVALVRRGHVHDAVDDDRRDLQVAGVRDAEQPRRRQPADGRLLDLRQRRVAVAAGIAVVGRPARLGRDRAGTACPIAAAGGRACRPCAAADRRSPGSARRRRGCGRRWSRSWPASAAARGARCPAGSGSARCGRPPASAAAASPWPDARHAAA